MANKKMTKRDYFQILRDTYPTSADNYDEVIGFIDHEMELLERKNSSDKKPTAQQVANDKLKSAILLAMEPDKRYTASEVLKLVDDTGELSNQKVSALLRLLKDAGLVERIEDKRKTYFQLV
jgi:Fe2+ or Zn2+ uptake regulation protein